MTITKYLSISKSKKKKRQSHSDYTDNPKLSQALLSINEDNWKKAINVDMNQMIGEKVYGAVLSIYPIQTSHGYYLSIPYRQPWVLSIYTI